MSPEEKKTTRSRAATATKARGKDAATDGAPAAVEGAAKGAAKAAPKAEKSGNGAYRRPE